MEPCYWSLDQLPGLSHEEITQFHHLEIQNTQQLIAQGHNLQSIQTLATQLKWTPQVVQKWIVLAQLATVPSVNCDYCGILLHAGVASVTQLAQMPIHRLQRQILRLQVATLQRRDLCPSTNTIQQWIQEARLLCSSSKH